MQLTPKQRRFADEYSLDHNGAASAVRAGYSPHSARITACRLLTNANVKAAVDAQGADAAARYHMTRDFIVEQLRSTIATARANGDAMAMVKAWGEIAKLCGFYVS